MRLRPHYIASSFSPSLLPFSPSSFDIALEFQTISSSALVLYMQGMAAMFADYMALELRGGQLYFSYNLGSGRAFIVSTGTYDDGFLHRVSLSNKSMRGFG